MSNLRESKQKRYRKNLIWVRRRWKDAKMYVSAGGGQRVKDDRLFRAVSRSAGTSPVCVKSVYHRKDTSRPLLRYLHASVMGLRSNIGVPEWL